jgi:hypothetical protein
MSVLAGSGTASYVDGIGTFASFNAPSVLALDAASSTLYVVDSNNFKIRCIAIATGSVSTLIGSSSGYVDGIGTFAKFKNINSIAFDPLGNRLFVADNSNYRIRQIGLPTGQVMTVVGNGLTSSLDGIGTQASTSASLQAVAVDPKGNYVMFLDGNRFRMLNLNNLVVTSMTKSGVFSNNPPDLFTFPLLSSPFLIIDPSGHFVYCYVVNVVMRIDFGSGSIRNVVLFNTSSIGGLAIDQIGNNLFTVAVKSASSSGATSITSGQMTRAVFSNVCPSGSYCSTGSNQPTLCPAGSKCPTGSEFPSECLNSECSANCNASVIGSNCSVGASNVNTCKIGFYCPNFPTQLLCPVGQYCGSTGLTAPSGNCSVGYYCAAGSRNAYGAMPTASTGNTS